MNRRKFIASALSAPFILSTRAFAQAPVFLGDMHAHSFFAESKFHFRPWAQTLAAGNATLVAWSITGDLLWFDFKTYEQKSIPREGEIFGFVQRELGRVRTHLAEQKLRTIRVAGDVDLALKGTPHVVMAIEGATFIENNVNRVKAVYDIGVRQLQLVHYTSNTLGDRQTNPPEHRGLSETGKRVVSECNRLGMLVDLTHCSEATARDALSVSRVPVIWSHGSVAKQPTTNPSAVIWRRRQLSLELAKEIAAKGGVVGIWTLAPDVGKTVESYADRVLELAEWIGEDHVAFGTDMNGLGLYKSLSDYTDLKRVIDYWRSKGIPESRIAKLAIGNYARVLKTALAERA